MNWKVQLTPDAGGYITQQCPDDCCTNRPFKVLFGNGSKEPIVYCPYCGHPGQFWTLEQNDYLHCMGKNQLHIPPPQGPCTEPKENGGPWQVHKIRCPRGHAEWIKFQGPKQRFYCIVHGVREIVLRPPALRAQKGKLQKGRQ